MTVAANGLSELNDVASQIARAEAVLEDAKKERDALIVELLSQGYSEREVARASGVSAPRVHQIKGRVERDKALAALPECRGFWWIGQSMEHCDGPNCGKPAWEHDGLHGYDKDAGPFDTNAKERIIPWDEAPNLFKHYATDKRTGKPFWELMEEADA